MKRPKLSQTSNLSDKLMNPSEHFNHLKNEDHSASFDQLPTLMNTREATSSNGWRPIYKVAATFLITCLTFVACSLPVQQEEEIGYMIKGVSTTPVKVIKGKIGANGQADIGINPDQLSINNIVHEEVGKDPQTLSEVIMVLPEANLELAKEKKQALNQLADFRSLEILPIEETVERPLYEAALNKVDLLVDKSLSDVVVAARINEFLHANSQSDIKANLDVNEEGERVVKLYLNLAKNLKVDESTNVKRSLERLIIDVTAHEKKQKKHVDMSKEELLKLKQLEIQRKKELQEKDN